MKACYDCSMGDGVFCSECWEWSCFDCFAGVHCGKDTCWKPVCGECMNKKMELCVECDECFCRKTDEPSDKNDCFETHECGGPGIS
jgi:hypothetical protein